MQRIRPIAYRESNRLGIAHPFFAPTILDGGVIKFATGQVSENVVAGFLRAARTDVTLTTRKEVQRHPEGRYSKRSRTSLDPRMSPTRKEEWEKPYSAETSSSVAGSSMNVVSVLGENDIIMALFSERRGQSHVEFVRLAVRASGIRIIADGVARLNAID
jgi:hypothetical protein